METSTIYKTKKVNSINQITVEIEESFMNNWSVLAYDEEGDVYIEKFAKNYNEAVLIADKLLENICKEY